MKFGPAGLGGAKEAVSNLQKYAELGLKACEIAFTYGVYLKKPDAKIIGEAAEKLGIKLSIHAPYWINLNSAEKRKTQESKKRILDCCEIGNELKATHVVFHPGYYGKMSKEETFENIKKEILEIVKEIHKKSWKIEIAPETTGKINVFGSIEEISELVKETKCSFCIDFAHILAREKKVDYEKIKAAFPQKSWHVHFSGIIYGDKGERSHKITDEKDIRHLLENLPKTKDITIINESPSPVVDSVKGLKISEKL